jgi:benzoyl-CoA reductase/2-hydroxyglutaryl-CoA dehydratase subunit BcrC/BadD/HgdB
VSTTAIADLCRAFAEPFAALGQSLEQDRRAVVISWPAVPVEIVNAAGLVPVLARGARGLTPAADAWLEPGVFPSRLRQLVEAALTGRLAGVSAILLPRTSDPDYKCFLYLREFQRRGLVAALPPILLFDLLQSDSADVPAYDAARVRDLLEELASVAGRQSTGAELRREIDAANAARAAARCLNELRRREPRVAGSEALQILGAFWQLPPAHYVELARAAAEAIGKRTPLPGPRVLLAGAPVDTPDLHAVVEAEGAVVVAELSPYGSAAAGEDVELAAATAADGLAEAFGALAEKYRRDSITPRTPAALLERRLEALFDGVDAVIVCLPPDDAVFGFDYPALRALLARRGLPHAVLRGDPALGTTTAGSEQIASLLAGTAIAKAARYG